MFIVDADREARVAMESALHRRFAPDYRVLAADSAEAGLDALERLAREGDEVALVAADLRLPGMDGVEFLGRAQLLHPGARPRAAGGHGSARHAHSLRRAGGAPARHRAGTDRLVGREGSGVP